MTYPHPPWPLDLTFTSPWPHLVANPLPEGISEWPGRHAERPEQEWDRGGGHGAQSTQTQASPESTGMPCGETWGEERGSGVNPPTVTPAGGHKIIWTGMSCVQPGGCGGQVVRRYYLLQGMCSSSWFTRRVKIWMYFWNGSTLTVPATLFC